nr:predicted GPI-anchored protein 58 [Equus asinus]
MAAVVVIRGFMLVIAAVAAPLLSVPEGACCVEVSPAVNSRPTRTCWEQCKRLLQAAPPEASSADGPSERAGRAACRSTGATPSTSEPESPSLGSRAGGGSRGPGRGLSPPRPALSAARSGALHSRARLRRRPAASGQRRTAARPGPPRAAPTPTPTAQRRPHTSALPAPCRRARAPLRPPRSRARAQGPRPRSGEGAEGASRREGKEAAAASPPAGLALALRLARAPRG